MSFTISWKETNVYCNHTLLSSETFSDGQYVKFTVRFNLRGIHIIKVESMQPSNSYIAI